MFIHKNQLRHLLRPEHYTSEAQHQAELEQVFEPAWHLVGLKSELARPGNFLSFDLLGRPVLLRNMDGEIRAFLNVCSHRHSMLTSVSRGSSPRLRCQYHGWEYDADGRTARIPDAQCFRPFDRENACLKLFRVATVADLIFVSLVDEGPTLAEFLGPLYGRWEESFGGDFWLAGKWEGVFPCNWKVVVENSLESYHIPLVHPKTFRRYPRAEVITHVLDERYTTFRADQSGPHRSFKRSYKGAVLRGLGKPQTFVYEHQNIHPHLTYSGGDFHRLAMVVYPLSPTTCYYRHYAYALRGSRGGIVAPLLARLLRSTVARIGKKVFLEDASIYEAVQKGITSSPHPGVIGTREERIYVFQQYVSRLSRGEDPGPDLSDVPVESAEVAAGD